MFSSEGNVETSRVVAIGFLAVVSVSVPARADWNPVSVVTAPIRVVTDVVQGKQPDPVAVADTVAPGSGALLETKQKADNALDKGAEAAQKVGHAAETIDKQTEKNGEAANKLLEDIDSKIDGVNQQLAEMLGPMKALIWALVALVAVVILKVLVSLVPRREKSPSPITTRRLSAPRKRAA
jgi:hypothetical protein